MYHEPALLIQTIEQGFEKNGVFKEFKKGHHSRGIWHTQTTWVLVSDLA